MIVLLHLLKKSNKLNNHFLIKSKGVVRILQTALQNNIFEYTDKKLKAHLQNNEDFNRELITMFEFYKTMLFDRVSDSDKDRLERDLFQSIKSQIFNGYFMAQELLNSKETQFEDQWFQQSEGMIAQQLPEMLRIATNDNIDEIITLEPLKELTSWLVIKYEGVYPLLRDISLNTACMGAKWSFIDEAKKRGVTPYQPQFPGILANVDDVVFINPQTYLSCDITNESSELWTVITSKYNGLDKIAEVTLIKVPSNEKVERYYMNVNMKNSLSLAEQQNLVDHLAAKLMVTQNLERNQIILAAASVEAFYEINNNTD